MPDRLTTELAILEARRIYHRAKGNLAQAIKQQGLKAIYKDMDRGAMLDKGQHTLWVSPHVPHKHWDVAVELGKWLGVDGELFAREFLVPYYRVRSMVLCGQFDDSIVASFPYAPTKQVLEQCDFVRSNLF